MTSNESRSPLTPEKILADLDRYKLTLTVDKIKSDFDAFCTDYDFNKTALGLQAVGDGAFRSRLDKGASASLKRITELYAFMRLHIMTKHRENLNGIID